MTPSEQKKQRAQRIRTRIIESARLLVVENGFEQLSLRGIARRVGYSPAALYDYFDSKDDIIEAVCVEIDQNIHSFIEKRMLENSFDPPLLRVSLGYIEFATTHPDDFRLLFFHNLYQECSARDLLQEQVIQSIDMGEIVPQFDFEEEEITHSIWSMAHGMAMLALCRAQYASASHLHREALSRLIDGLRNAY